MGELIALILLGVLVGALIGGLGGGGGVVAVPLFLWVTGMSATEAGTMSLLAVAAAAVIAVVLGAFAREIRWRWVAVFALVGVGGSVLGSVTAAFVPEPVILGAFGLVVAFATVRFVVGLVRERARTPPGPPARGSAALAALGIGGVTGLVGVGGGFLIAPALMRLVRMAPHLAVATSSAVILVNCLSSLAARAVLGLTIDVGVAAPVLAGAVAGAVVGKLAVARAPAAALQWGSGGLLVVCCLAAGASVAQSVWIS